MKEKEGDKVSASSLSLIILRIVAYYLGPVVCGYICGRLRRIVLLFLVLPPVILVWSKRGGSKRGMNG